MCRYNVTTTEGTSVGVLADSLQSALAQAMQITGELPDTWEPVLNRYEVTLWDGLSTVRLGVYGVNAQAAMFNASNATGGLEVASVTEVTV